MVQFNQSSYFFFWKAIICWWWWWYRRDRSIFFLFGRRVSLTSNFKPRTNILHLWRVWKRHFILITSHNATASQPSLGQCIFGGLSFGSSNVYQPNFAPTNFDCPTLWRKCSLIKVERRSPEFQFGNWIHWVREEKRNAQIDQFWVTKKAINQRTIFLPTWGFLKTLEHLTELQCSAPAEWLFFKTQNERIILRDFGISGWPHAGLDDSWSFAKITSLPSQKFWYTSNFSLL